jgi:hypothetical protein
VISFFFHIPWRTFDNDFLCGTRDMRWKIIITFASQSVCLYIGSINVE